MNLIKVIKLFILQFFLLYACTAQEKYRAVLWGINDGLSMPGANHMIKDKNGFLWVSSRMGTSRFDGNTFKNYDNSGGYTAFAMIEDSLHNIWTGANEGIFRYDIKADTFSNFKMIPDSLNANQRSFPVWATQNEVFAVNAQSKTIYAVNIHSYSKRILVKLESTDNIENIIYDAKSNNLWIPEGDPYNTNGGLLSISLSTRIREYYNWPCFKKIDRNPQLALMTGHSHRAQSMCFDKKRNCLWLNTQDGLMQFTLEDKQFHHIAAFNDWVNRKDYNFPESGGITLDLLNRVWVSTYPKGFFIYDPVSHSASLPFRDSVIQNINNVRIYADRDSMIWLSYHGPTGIYQLIPSSPVVTHYHKKILDVGGDKEEMVIQNFVPANKGKIWIGSGWQGLYSFDPTTGSVALIRKDIEPGVHLDSQFPMMIDTIMNKAWIGVERRGKPWGIFEMDINTLQYKPLIFKDISKQVMTPERISFLNARPFKNGFLFSIDWQGIFYVNKDSLVAQQALAVPASIWQLIVANDQYLFLYGSKPLGRAVYSYQNNQWKKISHPFDSIEWVNIYYDKKDRTYWICEQTKLLHYNSAFQRIGSYSEKDGLPPYSWHTITSDDAGNIWLSTPAGVIAQLNVQTSQVTTLSDKDGYQKNFLDFDGPFLKDNCGHLYFSGADGIDRVSPDKFKSAPPSSVYLQSLEVNQQPVSLSAGINNLQELSLIYSQNKISIGTGIIDFYSKGKSQIRYQLQKDGKAQDWQYAPDYYTIRYDGLQHGKYRLVIQASNATNEFNGPEKVFQINISPPFWLTWWFITSAIILLISIFYLMIRWWLNRKFRLQLERSEKEKQFAELNQKTTELEMQALRAQMNPHFIFNSLNSINMFILENNKLQASEYLSKFSRLVRLILQNSQEAFIPLENELEALRLYLQLESLRFQNKFEYQILVNDELDAKGLKVPALIIQPYVENAIWHGLMHKKEKGNLEIAIYLENESLFYRITDDGIGRKNAAELKSKSASTHKSMGMRITTDRLATLQHQNETSLTITDLVLPDGKPGGTEVLIRIPAYYD
jgi:ligand-binding sensor domain-containing protein